MKDILFALWFFLPAGLANAAPVFANKIPGSEWLAVPIDGGKHFRGKRITGNHKNHPRVYSWYYYGRAGILAASCSLSS